MKIISWNIAHSEEPLRVLAKCGADVALVQEAGAPPAGLDLEIDEAPWETAGGTTTRKWRTAVVRLSDRVSVRWRSATPLPEGGYDDLRVGLPGTLAVADVEDRTTGEVITVVSIYGSWGEAGRGD